MLRAFRSELIKLSRWSVLGGGAAMIAITALFAYVFIGRATGTGLRLAVNGKTVNSVLAAAVPTSHGLVTVLAAAQPIVSAIAIIIVAANVAGEWSQGTLRNLLVREPDRLRLLAGKMLALLLFVILATALAMLAGAAVTLLGAQANGISTAPWTSSDGVKNFLTFFANGLLGAAGVSLLGMLIALLTRSMAAAVGIAVAYVLVGEALIEAVWPDGAQWLPAHIFGYLPGVASPMSYGPAPMGYGSDLLVALLYMAGFIAVGFAAFRIMDISA